MEFEARHKDFPHGLAWRGVQLSDEERISHSNELIERLWKFIKRRVLYGRDHPTFADFQAAIEETLDGLPNTHAKPLSTLMTLHFQQFANVSLMAA